MAESSFLRTLQYIAFFVALFDNILLLLLIHTRASKSFGRYKVLMITFSVYSIIYATIEVFTLPIMHLHGSGILFFVDSMLKNNLTIGVAISSVYCGSFALCISMLTVHFIYRYFALCRTDQMHYFEGYKIYLWFLIPFTCFLMWTGDMAYSHGPDQFKKDYFRKEMLEIYQEDIDETAFIACIYYDYLPDGSRRLRFPDFFSAGLISTIISMSFVTCCFCGFKTYKKMHDVTIRMSSRTRALNKQLFWTLGLQTVLPCLTQYSPVSLLFLIPMFEMEVGKLGNLVGVTCSLYPAMDPLIAIFIIDRFRGCFIRKKATVSTKTYFSSDAHYQTN